jgi:hypothetical protein
MKRIGKIQFGAGITLCALIIAIAMIGCRQKQSASLVSATAFQTNSNDVQQIQSDVKRLLNALYAGDMDSILKATPPEVITLMGGEVKTRQMLKAAVQGMQASGAKLESVTFPESPTFLKTDLHQFAVVPTKNIIIFNESRFESLHFQIGIKNTGATNWTFIDGEQASNVNKIFPDFPANFQFPPISTKKI